MMARRGVLGLFAGGMAALLSGCGGLIPNSYRFRMTVEVETPEGVRRGSSVYEVKAANVSSLLPEERKRDWTVTGEAVAVGLPGDRILFALLRTVNPMREDLALMSMAALDPLFKNDVVESAARLSSGGGRTGPIPVVASDYPMLIAFRDIEDPKSVERVNPANLASAFGADVKLKAITVERTNENISTGIESILTWLPNHHGALQQIPIAEYPPPGTPLPLAANITEADFKKGILK